MAPDPLGLGQLEAARRLGVSNNQSNEIILGKRSITADYGASALTIGEDVTGSLLIG
jgi:plasmid maintenance system antidote protein VapI